MVKAVLPHLHARSTIVNTSSDTALLGMGNMVDYVATKGAIISFTRSLSQQLVNQGIRVNVVCPPKHCRMPPFSLSNV